MATTQPNVLLSGIEARLLEHYQRDLPLVEHPYAAMAKALNTDEPTVLNALNRLTECGAVTRVGPVFRPHRVGTSTLVAMQVPAARLEQVAERVNRYPEVNHNYEREHAFNLWFVVTAADETHLERVLDDIRRQTGLELMSLPMLEAYHLDLGFSLGGKAQHEEDWITRPAPVVEPLRQTLAIRDETDRRIVAAIQTGLSLVPRPFARAAEAAGISEPRVRHRLGEWLGDGTISRFGIVVRHREFGYRANAMVVWDVPDDSVRKFGCCFGRYDFVTLCYHRPRRPPAWRYNLFCMIHGQDRGVVEERVRLLASDCGLEENAYSILFSQRRFKQRGARYVVPATSAPNLVEA